MIKEEFWINLHSVKKYVYLFSRPTRTNYHRSHHSNSEGATSPNESDNTYAEASLLQQTSLADQHQIQQQRQQPIRYGQYNPSFVCMPSRDPLGLGFLGHEFMKRLWYVWFGQIWFVSNLT